MERYVIVTPVRDEENFIRLTLKSVVNQTVQPTRWIIVDDGSVDGTAKIVQEYIDKYSWIELVSLTDRGFRQPGEGVARVFNAGLEKVDSDYDFIVKLDGDLSFAPDCFERLFQRFASNPKLGIAGGGCYIPKGNRWVLERVPADHVRGATKVYKKECFVAIGGLPICDGWDTVDEMRAQMKGWETRGYEEIQVRHHRPTGATEGKLKGYVKRGEFAFFLGYSLPVIVARSVYRCVMDRPLILAGLAIFWGYLKSWLAGKPQFDDAELIAYIRRKQLRRLAFFRSRQ